MDTPSESATATDPGRRRPWFWRSLLGLLAALGLLLLGLMAWWDQEPHSRELPAFTSSTEDDAPSPVGAATTGALIAVAETLLDKRGGYLSNDVLPPGILMDNLPNWEFGALTQCRDLARALRNEFSRSQTQSLEDPDLAEADPLFSFSNDRFILPSTESQYRKAIGHVEDYRQRLLDPADPGSQFYARADNLAAYLAVVETRLGGLSQRLSASVVRSRLNTDLANDGQARQSTPAGRERSVQTGWTRIDDVFYEARGSSFALAAFLRAIDQDFARVLDDKNARVSLQQVIRELEEAQAPIRSPIILNGSPFGFFSNHSLVLANYLSRANAALIDLRKLLERG